MVICIIPSLPHARLQNNSVIIKGYDTFGNLVRLPRNQGKSQQKSLEIKKSGFTSEITSCHQILFEIHVKSSLHIKYM